MANTYTYTGPGTRWATEDATAEDFLNVSRINCDHLHEALNTIMDTDAADGVLTGMDLTARFSAPFQLVNNIGGGKAWSIFIRDTDDMLVVKKATGTTPPSPTDEDDYDAIISEVVDVDSSGPAF
jgi:hypothetical protein